MKYLPTLALSVISIIFLANLTQQASTNGKSYPDVNFQGVINTQSGTQLNVENILIAGKYKQIPVFERPTVVAEKNTLNYDPSDKKRSITSYLDLAEIKTIRIDNPTIFTYQREKGFSKTEFVEITVASTNNKDPEKQYLIKLSSTITCDEIHESGPVEKVIPFIAITSMTINDFKSQTPDAKEQTCRQQCRARCKEQQ